MKKTVLKIFKNKSISFGFALILIAASAFTASAHTVNPIQEGGTNIGGGETGSNYLAEWVYGQTGKLRAFKQRAALKLNSTGDDYKANQILFQGLVLSVSGDGRTGLIDRALMRGSEMFRVMGGKNPRAQALVKRNINRVMNSYYDLITKDIDSVVALQKGYRQYRDLTDDLGFDSHEFNKKVIVYAANQISWFINTFTANNYNSDEGYIAIGSTAQFLKVTEIILQYVRSDIIGSLFKYRYACVVHQIAGLSEQVEQHNIGNTEIFDGDRMAELYVIIELKNILNSLENGNCN